MNKKQIFAPLICLILVSGCKSLFHTNETVGTPSGESNFLDMYYINSEGEKIENVEINDSVQLVIITENMIGDKIDLDFRDEVFMFKYKNKLLKKRFIKGMKVTVDTINIPLVIDSWNYKRKGH